MEDISPIAGPRRYPLTIPNAAGLQDHRFLGQAVLPAVHAMDYLARTVGRVFPDVVLASSADIRFDKFLVLPPPDIPQVEAFVELDVFPDGESVAAVLLTRHVAAKSGMTRMKVHVRSRFGRPVNAEDSLPQAPAWPDAQKDVYHLSVERLYAEMVPFGTVFQNVVSRVALRPEGALATVSGGALGTAEHAFRLGSPFCLDAALHIACAWAQRYAGIVAFPVALQKRVILNPTLPGKEYLACVRYKEREGDGLLFDLWLHDRAGQLCEIVQGLTMRDVSGGKLRPPTWISAHIPDRTQ